MPSLLLKSIAPTAFSERHLGSSPSARTRMLAEIGAHSLDALSDSIVPPAILRSQPLAMPPALTEEEALDTLRHMASQNTVFRSHIGMGFHPCHTPAVILRNVLENPGWYTQYTPYQAEIAQGRLETLFYFQTLVAELTGLPFANASLLDEATACAEALTLAASHCRSPRKTAVADLGLHPQNLQLLHTRARVLGLRVVECDVFNSPLPDDTFLVIVQTPDTRGLLKEGLRDLAVRAHADGALVAAVTDPLALCLLEPPAAWGADIAIGSSQRFGLPMGFGGPHAGYMAVNDALKRRMPGRIVGLSIDSKGRPAYRLALQTREQHIRREKATSNICTAQALPAILSTFYAVYHGPIGLRRIASRCATLADALARALRDGGLTLLSDRFFDTLNVLNPPAGLREKAECTGINLRYYDDGSVGIALDETSTIQHLQDLLALFGIASGLPTLGGVPSTLPLRSEADFLPQAVFRSFHTEHEMLRFMHRLQGRDLSLTHSMISLGSCTMKLNATAEMIPVTWPEFGNMHPAAPTSQCAGYTKLCSDLELWLSDITALPGCSLQPNAGSQGEYAGLLAIREYHHSRGQAQRDICLIPASAHGTNPASAVMAGFQVVAVACDDAGNVDLPDLSAKAAAHAERLAALMITYPSTHGVFEESVPEICRVIHAHGGQVYMDGANMNAQVGLTAPGIIGADVCHLNLHKTFCIPHGGGGPGMGPICCAEHLRPFLPSNPFSRAATPLAISSAPFGSASILVIPWMYIRMMGPGGLKQATQTALLNANYMAKHLELSYPILYAGRNGRVAHEFILDLRELTRRAGLIIDDIAKRLMDYGFHAPTMSFPVPGTLMIEPTESESQAELDRFCEAMIAIRREIQDVIDGKIAAGDSPLHHAPHTAEDLLSDSWNRAYTREQAAYPLQWVRERKFWPAVSRIDNTHGDRNLICTCEWDPKG